MHVYDHPLLMQTLLDSMTGRTKTWTDTHDDLYMNKVYIHSVKPVHIMYVQDFTVVEVGGRSMFYTS